jgi:predicted SAM-dependent methyltransferase
MIKKIKNLIRPIYNKIKKIKEKREFEKGLSRVKQEGGPLKIVIGSSGIPIEGWLLSEAHFLDLLDVRTWKVYFNENQIDCLLAEHVWEHLTEEQGIIAAKNCCSFLKKGGSLRVAVPDGYHRDKSYISYVKPGGHGAGADDHKVLYNYQAFSSIFEENGFKVELLEYFDENNKFVEKKWNSDRGNIFRSIKHDKRNINGEPIYTSLLLDAIKY